MISLKESPLQGKPIVTKELILRLCDSTPTMLPTTTAHRYLVPTALGASDRRIPTAVVVAAVVVVVVTVEGTAATFRPEVALAVIAAAVLFLAVLLGGPEEPKGLAAHRLVVIGGGVDLLFRGGVDSVRRGVFFLACNTRFIKEHKPSNHIRARIKSHVHTTE